MKRIIMSGSIVMAFFLLAFAGPARSQTDSRDAVPYESITLREESTIENTMIVAMRRISQARSDIHRQALASAGHELAEAVRLLETIRDNLSTAAAKNFIRIARNHLGHEPARKVLGDLPPIYASLETASVYLPTDKAKERVDRAKDYLNKNDKKGADTELALADKSLIVIEVEQPLLDSQKFVARAQEYLAAKKTKKADDALQQAERQAMALITGVTSPLYLAKQNIWLAFSNYSSARRAESRIYLEKARKHLSRATKAGSATSKEEADKLLRQIAELEKKLGSEEKIKESALKGAWEKSKALAERSAAYLSARISEAETTLGGENSLIEARLHVAYAETYKVTTAEPEPAAKELDTALSWLQKAVADPLAGPEDREKIRDVGNLIKVLRDKPEKNDLFTQERFDTVKEELNDLIRRL